MKILVTGGAGFIGSNVVDAYIKEGHEVVVVDNLSSGSLDNVNPKAKFYLMDIRSRELAKLFEIERPDVVNHHAAQKSVPKSVKDPIYDAEINVIGLLNVLEQCAAHHTKRVIAISSGALAGDADRIPTDETYEPKMVSPYAITKHIMEKYLHFYSVTYGLKYVVFRYANVYGPRQAAEGECGVIPIFLNNILADKPSTLMTYSDMPKGTTRDYVYVGDVCRANILGLTKGDNEIFCIGRGEELFIEDIYNTMCRVIGKDIPLNRAGERIGDVRRNALDYSKAKRLLGWEPKVPLEEGISLTTEYYKSK